MSSEFKFEQRVFGLPPGQAAIKRVFDIAIAFLLLVMLWWLLLLLVLIARLDTGHSGLFKQQRVGLFGQSFTVFKIRTMRPMDQYVTNVTTENDPRITPFGRLMRRLKLDELPQLMNVLNGSMSFVGPRPDVPEAYRDLSKEDLRVLTIRPGITGPASIRFKNEESLLAAVDDPETYNKQIIMPEKIKLNLEYIRTYSIWKDIKLMFETVF